MQNWWQQHRYSSDNDENEGPKWTKNEERNNRGELAPLSNNSEPQPPLQNQQHPLHSSHWPHFARQRTSLKSPNLPDEELNSMLQNYLDEKYQNHKMDYEGKYETRVKCG